LTEQERDELLATTAYFFVQRALKARTFKNQSKWVKVQDMGGPICPRKCTAIVEISYFWLFMKLQLLSLMSIWKWNKNSLAWLQMSTQHKKCSVSLYCFLLDVICRLNAVSTKQDTWDLVISLKKEDYPVNVKSCSDGRFEVNYWSLKFKYIYFYIWKCLDCYDLVSLTSAINCKKSHTAFLAIQGQNQYYC